MAFSTIFQSYQNDGIEIMKGLYAMKHCLSWDKIYTPSWTRTSDQMIWNFEHFSLCHTDTSPIMLDKTLTVP